MRDAWDRFLRWLTPGARSLLAVWTALFLAGLILQWTHRASLQFWLGLNGPAFWHGQLWRLFIYWLVSNSLADFLISGLMLAVLARSLERFWSRADLWVYCLIAAVGAGLVKVLAQPSNPIPLLGLAPVTFGLIAAWGRLFANEKMMLFGSFEMAASHAAILFGAISFIMIATSAGLANALITVSGALGGILYLAMRSKLASPRTAQPAASQRINRLEL